mmetsp:Transcript_6515/g.10156  ORF Transcript_6515/g.10156 Transcript_6515/m.10156 type:complete len:147 (-) Transcript_6515:251-691(-)
MMNKLGHSMTEMRITSMVVTITTFLDVSLAPHKKTLLLDSRWLEAVSIQHLAQTVVKSTTSILLLLRRRHITYSKVSSIIINKHLGTVVADMEPPISILFNNGLGTLQFMIMLLFLQRDQCHGIFIDRDHAWEYPEVRADKLASST